MKTFSLLRKVAPAVVLAALLLPGYAATTVVIDEQFSDGTRSTAYKNPTTGVYESLAWYASATTSGNTLAATTGSMTITTMATGGNIAARMAVAQFDGVTLGVGETLALSFDAVFTGITNASTNNNALHFGLFNASASGTVYTADGQNPYTTAVGFDVRQLPYETATGESRSYLGYRSYVSPSTTPLMTSVGPKAYPSTDVYGPLANNETYSYNLSAQLVSATELQLTLTISDDGGTLLTQTTTLTGANVYTYFDTIAFSAYDTTAGIGVDSVSLSNIQLTLSSIPEAGFSALAISLVAVLALARRSRRR